MDRHANTIDTHKQRNASFFTKKTTVIYSDEMSPVTYPIFFIKLMYFLLIFCFFSHILLLNLKKTAILSQLLSFYYFLFSLPFKCVYVVNLDKILGVTENI